MKGCMYRQNKGSSIPFTGSTGKISPDRFYTTATHQTETGNKKSSLISDEDNRSHKAIEAIYHLGIGPPH